MKILVLSDSTMSVNSGGLSQTLYNIFSFCNPEDILCIVPKESHKTNPPTNPFKNCYTTYLFEIIGVPRNRLSKYITPFATWFNYSYNRYCRNFKKIKKRIQNFKPDVVVSCSNGPVGLFMHHKLLECFNIKKIFPYFMDDWMFQKRHNWLDQQIFKWAKKILSDNLSWLMISKELSDILEERYNVKPTRVLEIHNPVNLSNLPDVTLLRKKQEYTLAYAGSLWPMHLDAFLAVAEGVKQLKEKRKINLIIYTSLDFWNWRKAILEPLGVIYGGSIPYKQIHQKLSEADGLILSSSFFKEWYTYSKGSLQTKITDYLKAKRLIISCGPDYSANHNFLRKNKCGICIETNDELSIVSALNEILDNIEEYQTLVYNGWKLLENEFTFSKVHEKLQSFLSASCN